MDERVATNQRRWEEMTELHVMTYRIDERDAHGEFLLKPFERDEIGSIERLRICHLQSHIGDDSFALAQLGAAEVLGVDFSARSVEIASMRVERLGLADRVRFIQTTVDDATDVLSDVFDGVYTSWGVLSWLPNIERWAATVSGLLRPGGWLYLAETHPYAAAARWRSYPYGGTNGVFDDDDGDYTDAAAQFEHSASWAWNHGLGEIITALVKAGLAIEWLHEHPVVAWHLSDQEHLVERPDGMWEEPGSTLPLSFSLRAIKT
jgi:SAM-dependent methyltransferase